MSDDEPRELQSGLRVHPAKSDTGRARDYGLTVVLAALAVVAVAWVAVNGTHLWRSIGPGSAEYRACKAELDARGDHDVADVLAYQEGDTWVFNFEVVTGSGDSAIPEHVRCTGRDGTVQLSQ